MVATTLNGVLLTGDHASRPTATTVAKGTLYACSTHSLIYQSDASSWSTWATLTGTGLTDPMTTRGDIIIRNSSNTTARLGRGSAGTVLTSDGTDVSWGSASGGGTNYAQIYVPASDPVSLTGAWTIVEYTDIPTAATTPYRGIAYQSSGTQNDEISFDLWMDGGTYAIHVLGRKSSNTGIITVNIDASSAGTIDTYAASPALLSSRLTGVSISAGKRTVQFKMATKNASSSGYYGELLQVILRRTA